ncbi:MAG TPA: hypothetical protein VJ770_24190 [Stellaceae bacterium]|nr:hypothetical protein [Stellaceae bacterium]
MRHEADTVTERNTGEAGRTHEEAGHAAPDRPARSVFSEPSGQRGDPTFLAWLRFWAQLVILAALTIFGAAVASNAQETQNYQAGMMLAVAAFALLLLLVKRRLDGESDNLFSLVLVDDISGLWLVVPLFTIAALIGIIIAGIFQFGTWYIFGLGLFGASVIAILLQIKHVFDRIDRGEG